jgi:hypothetical protein
MKENKTFAWQRKPTISKFGKKMFQIFLFIIGITKDMILVDIKAFNLFNFNKNSSYSI